MSEFTTTATVYVPISDDFTLHLDVFGGHPVLCSAGGMLQAKTPCLVTVNVRLNGMLYPEYEHHFSVNERTPLDYLKPVYGLAHGTNEITVCWKVSEGGVVTLSGDNPDPYFLAKEVDEDGMFLLSVVLRHPHLWHHVARPR
jgi:hypothetical protein